MNKLIYAIGIALATTFAANTKTDDSKTKNKEIPSIKNIEKIPITDHTDSLKVDL